MIDNGSQSSFYIRESNIASCKDISYKQFFEMQSFNVASNNVLSSAGSKFGAESFFLLLSQILCRSDSFAKRYFC